MSTLGISMQTNETGPLPYTTYRRPSIFVGFNPQIQSTWIENIKKYLISIAAHVFNPTLGRQRLADFCEFKDSLG